jgi:hypothetical protein
MKLKPFKLPWQAIVTFLLLFVTAAVLLVSYRTQVNADNICAGANVFATKHDQLIDELVRSLRQGTILPAAEQADRIHRYESVKAKKIKC